MNIFLVWVYVIILTVSSVTKAFIPDLYIVVFLVSSGPRELQRLTVSSFGFRLTLL